MCTNKDTINTGISIETVRESKLNPQNIFKDSESSHLNSLICTGLFDIPTSTNVNTDITVVRNTQPHVISCDPVTPIFLPKKPDAIEPNKGRITRLKYII